MTEMNTERPWFSMLTKEEKVKAQEDMVRQLIDHFGWEATEDFFVDQLGFILVEEQETDELVERIYIKPGDGAKIVFGYGKDTEPAEDEPEDDLPQGKGNDDDQHP